ISNVGFAIALGTPSAALAAASGMKSFFALKATGSVALVGISGFDLSMQSVTVEINQARPTVAGSTPRAVNFSSAPLVVPTGPASSLSLDFAGTLFRASGYVSITIGDFVHLSGSVA